MLKSSILACILAGLAASLASCSRKEGPAPYSGPPAQPGQLLRAGSIIVTEADLEQQLKDQHTGRNDEAARRRGLEELAARAQMAQAALDAGLGNDPIVRAEIARVLASRLKETALSPKLKELAAPVSESRLRELYEAQESRFRSAEKRQAAVLWLNPGADPERKKQYEAKLAGARAFLLSNSDLNDHPDLGFSVLSVDHSEHAATRYKGGVVGWLEQAGGMDQWTKDVAEIVFSLKEPGEVSAVSTRSGGVFLVRYMAQKVAVQRSFVSVKAELDQEERRRLREEADAAFRRGVEVKNPLQWLTPPSAQAPAAPRPENVGK